MDQEHVKEILTRIDLLETYNGYLINAIEWMGVLITTLIGVIGFSMRYASRANKKFEKLIEASHAVEVNSIQAVNSLTTQQRETHAKAERILDRVNDLNARL